MPAYIPAAKRSDWRTPPEVLSVVRRAFNGPITLDPCASDDCPLDELIGWFNARFGVDGLAYDWGGAGNRVFVNPPFGANAEWVHKCGREAEKGAEIILLIPARTDTRYWHQEIAITSAAVCLWQGRIRFVGAPHAAPFPCAFVYWGKDVDRFESSFALRGHVIRTFNPLSIAER